MDYETAASIANLNTRAQHVKYVVIADQRVMSLYHVVALARCTPDMKRRIIEKVGV